MRNIASSSNKKPDVQAPSGREAVKGVDMTDDDNEPTLGPNRSDRTAGILRSVVSFLPLGGGFLAEIISNVIPGQRVERIENYLLALGQKLDALEALSRDAISKPENSELVEIGAYDAVRAISKERIDFIAECVAEGVAAVDGDKLRAKRILKLLAQIDDNELQLLIVFGMSYGGRGHEAQNLFEGLQPPPAHMGSSREEINAETVYELGKANLERLGLLQKRFSNLKRGELPEFDKSTGTFKGYIEISPLGRLVLREIGKPSVIDED